MPLLGSGKVTPQKLPQSCGAEVLFKLGALQFVGVGVGLETVTVTLSQFDACVVALLHVNLYVYLPAAVNEIFWLPAVCLFPDQLPVAEQFVAFDVLQLKVTDWLVLTPNEDAARLTTTPPGVEAFLVTV